MGCTLTDENGTNVQETGVDEPDVVKTDGSILVRIEDGDLATYDVAGDRPELLSTTVDRDLVR